MKDQLPHLPRRRAALGLMMLLATAGSSYGQAGDKGLKDKADALFDKGEYAAAYPLYSQLVSLSPQDHDLNYRFGACTLYGGDSKAKAIGYLKYAVEGPATTNLAWYFLGRAYQLDYRFDDALTAYRHYRGTADKKLLASFPVDALEQQCRNGKFLLSNLKDIEVLNKVEVAGSDFFRFYDLSDIGGKIVVTPPELLSNLDRKSGGAFLTYLPTGGGPIYFSSYGKDGKTGKDIYRSELLPTGAYSPPVKLTGYINTDQDEDYAVMAPDGKTFYFCSKGHNSMGGYDVFKSSYDKGMDTFSAPENMDFAVNTPADELLYIVGPDGKQACFASDRDSKQGMVNVYRVGTTQTPVNITLFKGTYASAFDASDRKAHIIVEDNLTREKVADVTTDMNGNYLLALPRSGTYTFLVEGGPSGLAHLQNVDVPPNVDPKVYRQEIQLVDQGGEKVAIKSYFDEPLPDDAMALAMDEIKRRARLDVTGGRPVAQAAQQPAAAADPLQAAGFDGTVTMARAVEMAQKDANDLHERAAVQGKQANAAFALALKNVSMAETEAAQARALVEQAATDAGGKDRLMGQAAAAKQRSLEANERARAAYRTARALDSVGRSTQQRAVAADMLASTLNAAKLSGDHAQAATALKELKANIDKQKGPERTVDETERTRRAATEASARASQRMKQANAQREDEALLNDRVSRIAGEMATAKGNKKEELGRQYAELEGQRAALHEEVEAAFAKAQHAEEEAALARGQAALVRYLGMGTDGTGDSAVAQDAIAGVEQRVANVRAGNKALVIDPQYGPATAFSAEEMERRTFDWGANEPLASVPHAASRTVARPTTDPGKGLANDAGNSSVNGQGEPGNATGTAGTGTSRQLAPAQDRNTNGVPASGAEATPAPADGTAKSAASAHSANVAGGKAAEMESRGARVDNAAESSQENARGAGGAVAVEARPTTGTINRNTPEPRPGTLATNGELPGTPATANSQVADTSGRDTVNGPGGSSTKGGAKEFGMGPTTTATDVAEQPAGDGSAPLGRDGAEHSSGITGEAGTTGGAAMGGDPDEQAFLLANKLAELQQLREGEKDRAKRDSLDRAIAAQHAQIAAFRAAGNAAPATTQTVATVTTRPVDYRPLEYDPSKMDEQLAEEAYPGFALRRKSIMEGPGSATDKANMLHALEMDLIDSIDVQTARSVALLQAEPDKADQVLPQLERWRNLKALHAANADKALADVGREYVATETKALEEDQLAAKAAAPGTAALRQRSTSPHNDAYVTIASDLARIYASPLVPRSSKNREAIAFKDRDLERDAAMQAEVDSMELVLQDMPAGKNYDKLRERTDRKIDDMLINKVDLGQRMAFISKSEYAVATDSAKTLQGLVAKRGLPPDEPLLQMARSYQGSADAAMDRAKGFRKEADRSEDAIKRNSLYQQAYGEELKALRDMDRSHTVRNYLLGAQAMPGESLTYDEIEDRMFPAEMAAGVPVKEDVPAVPAPAGEGGNAATASSGTRNGEGAAHTHEAIIGTNAAMDAASATKAVADSALLSGYLDKFYYLAPNERATVMGGEEERRYFLMKGRAMQERGDAEAARAGAEGAMQLAEGLRREAGTLRTAPDAQAGPEAMGKAVKLEVRADALAQRSDSLLAVADRLRSTATMDDAQAATFMQGLPADRSAAIMDLEQGKRRTEPVLARTRPEQADVARQATVAAAPVEQDQADAAPVGGHVPAPDRSDPGVERMAAANSAIYEAPRPFTGPLTRDVFAFDPVAAPRTEPIPIDVPMPKGVVYKVQVGAFRNALPAEAFSDMAPVVGEHAGNGLTRYTAGMFTSAESASKAGAKVRARGYRDAFVTAYVDGKRVPLREAMRLERLETVQAATSGTGSPVAALNNPVVLPPVALPPVAQEAPPPVQLPQAAPEAAVLAEYPASAEEVLAAFKPSATDYYNDPAAAPAKQVEVVKGLFFTVQVGVYSKPTALDKLFNITPLNSERTATGKIRYTTGIFLDEGNAQARKGTTVSLGVTDAFVTAYLNGKRIPVRDARALLAKFGRAVLVDPALATQ